MNCMVFVSNRQYCKPGPCTRKDVRVVRWAPTPLRTKVYRLCGVHTRILQENKKLELGVPK